VRHTNNARRKRKTRKKHSSLAYYEPTSLERSISIVYTMQLMMKKKVKLMNLMMNKRTVFLASRSIVLHIYVCHFKNWIKVRNRVKAHKLSTLIKFFRMSSSAFKIFEVCFIFMFLIKLVVSKCGSFFLMCVATTHSYSNNHLEDHPSGLKR
jgi:hypothetical protein